MSRAAVVVLLFAGVAGVAGVAACDKSSGASRTGPGSGTAVAPAADTVAVYLNDQQVAMIDAARLASWPRIDAVVPVAAQQLGTWTSMTVKGKNPTEIAQPAAKYANNVPVLYPGPDGPTLGWFDLVDLANKGAAKATFAGVTEIRIMRDEDSDRGMNEDGTAVKDFDPAQIDIAIDGGAVPVLAGKDIIAMQREAPPNGDTQTQGWKLTTLLDAAGIKNPPKVLLTDESGTSVTLTAAELDPAVSIPFLKLNKKGQLRFRVYTKQNDGWQLGGNLKGLSSIKVVK
jgi:hypothetical protein